MTFAVKIRAGTVEMPAELHDTPTARAIVEALPLNGEVRTWGDEIYFPVPVSAPLDATAKDIVEAGELGYWPTGKAFCIFFGPTPMSQGTEIRPASAVNIVGRVAGDVTAFKGVADGEPVRIERM